MKTIEVGTIMSYNAGILHVSFFQVIELIGKNTVVIREIESKVVKQSESNGWRSWVAPIKDSFIGEAVRKRINEKYPTMVKLDGSGTGTRFIHVWDGKSEYQDLLD